MKGGVEFQLTMGDDLTSVTLTVEVRGEGSIETEMDGADLSGLIDALLQARASLNDPIPMTLDPGRPQLTAVMPADVRWFVADPEEDGSIPLVLRHPGAGWTGFLLPTNDAREVAEWLLKMADQAQAPT